MSSRFAAELLIHLLKAQEKIIKSYALEFLLLKGFIS